MSNNQNNKHADPVVIAKYTTEFEAMLSKNMLVEAGIPAQVVGAMTAGFRAETPGIVKVLVPGDCEEQALKLLIEFTDQAEDARDARVEDEQAQD